MTVLLLVLAVAGAVFIAYVIGARSRLGEPGFPLQSAPPLDSETFAIVSDTWFPSQLSSNAEMEEVAQMLDTIRIGDVIRGMTVTDIRPWPENPTMRVITFSGEKVVSGSYLYYGPDRGLVYDLSGVVQLLESDIPLAGVPWNTATGGALIFANNKDAQRMFSPPKSSGTAVVRIRGLKVFYPESESFGAETELIEVIRKSSTTDR